jgi:hypothetical protein
VKFQRVVKLTAPRIIARKYPAFRRLTGNPDLRATLVSSKDLNLVTTIDVKRAIEVEGKGSRSSGAILAGVPKMRTAWHAGI